MAEKRLEDQTTRWLSSFDSPADVQFWIVNLGATFPQEEIEKIWRIREQRELQPRLARHKLDYKLMISGKRGHRRINIYRRMFDQEGGANVSV